MTVFVRFQASPCGRVVSLLILACVAVVVAGGVQHRLPGHVHVRGRDRAHPPWALHRASARSPLCEKE